MKTTAVMVSIVLFVLTAASVVAEYPEFPYVYTHYDEPLRPQFHFSSQSGWLNDVNGLWYHDGVYHMTYQHYPHGLAWAQMHWGYATSPDMIHWTQRPIALEPDVNVPGDCYSGSVVVDIGNTSGFRTGAEDVYVAIYTATRKGTCLAYSNDRGATWQAWEGNPVAIGTTDESTRDPHVFWHAATQRWVCAEWEENTTFYTSPDLKNWTRTSALAFGFECPDIFELPLDGGPQTRWVLLDAASDYLIGSFDGATFTPDGSSPGRMDQCPDFYASQSFFRHTFPDNRVIQLPWIRGDNATAPWTHEVGFPCEIGLKTFSDGIRTTRTPIAEIATLYADTALWPAQQLAPGDNLLADVKAKCFDLTAEFDLTGTTAAAITFTLPEKTITYDIANRTLLDRPLAPIDNRVTIRLLVDRGTLEVFGNGGRFSWTQKVRFTPGDSSIGLSVDGTAGLVGMRMHRIKRIWPHSPDAADFKTSISGSWTPHGGTWLDGGFGKQGTGSGDAFCMSDASGADFTYEADITLLMGTAAALFFRANATATAGYCVNIDAVQGVVKLWAPGRGELATHAAAITRGTAYHLKVEAKGSAIRVFFNRNPAAVIAYTDASPVRDGLFGLNIYNGTALFQNVTVNGDAVENRSEIQPQSGRITVRMHAAKAGLTAHITCIAPVALAGPGSLQMINLQGQVVLSTPLSFDGRNRWAFTLDKRVSPGRYICKVTVNGTDGHFEQSLPFVMTR